jgi:ornithine cyclodeaminase
VRNNDILILKAHETEALLEGQEKELIEIVRLAYEAHAAGESSLPHSTFLRFPGQSYDRIIALPAYLGQDFGVAGLKWIASFPDNIEVGLDRASAVVILNSTITGRPLAIIEGSVISAKRTGASAVLAAKSIQGETPSSVIGIIGCGRINFESVRFILAAYPEVKGLLVFDLKESRAEHFAEICAGSFNGIKVEVAKRVDEVLGCSRLISIATTATQPHLHDLSPCQPGTTILHTSLRDLVPEVILSCDNVVDDVDHVCRAATSIHLAEQMVGHREFIRCTLADILKGQARPRRDDTSITVFSPFGLGILDIAVGKFVFDRGQQQQHGMIIDGFLPVSSFGEQ